MQKNKNEAITCTVKFCGKIKIRFDISNQLEAGSLLQLYPTIGGVKAESIHGSALKCKENYG